MNCFEFRKLLLADPRVRTPEQERHLAGCDACERLVHETEALEARVHDAMRVPVPEALADRVLLRHRMRAPAARVWALAASLVAALGTGIYFYLAAVGEDERVLAASSLGLGHPAVTAIAHVLDEEPEMLRETRGVDPGAMRAAFARLGLNAPANGAKVIYFDKCPMTGGAGDHVVLQTPVGRVTLILVPGQSLGPRVAVTYRDRTAVVDRARSGSYILVADSLKNLRQAEKLLM